MVNDILLIAADADWRGKAQRALARDGMDVVAIDSLPEPDVPNFVRHDCTVIDGDALPQTPYVAIAMCMRFHPVVLVDRQNLSWLHEWVSGVVSDPEALPDLVRTVRTVEAEAA
jgi:hypothetical protein